MILTVAELKEFITTDVSDSVLEARLQALETSIRNATHNKFQDIRYRSNGDVNGNTLVVLYPSYFTVGDTITVGDDLCVINAIVGDVITLDRPLFDANNVLVTKVVYPMNIKMGVVDVITWLLKNPADKTGVVSETLSRHSISYQSNTVYDESFGCPKQLLSFLNQYKKARF